MAFNATWSPGPEAVADMQILGMVHGEVALVVHLDPDTLAIVPPRSPTEWPRFVGLLRQISEGADKLATFLDRPEALETVGR